MNANLLDGKPSVLIPIAPGTNRNEELANAFQAAGADAHQVPLQLIRSGEVKLVDHQLLAIPGGFSYGDALGAGRLLGLDLSGWFSDQLQQARDREMPMIGICNGFQALVKAGLLPGDVEPSPPSGVLAASISSASGPVGATLSENENGRFECRWVHLAPSASRSPWTAGLSEPIRCPVAHREGRFVASDLAAIEAADLVAFRYCNPDGSPAAGAYPANPNGSGADVAGIVDPTGLVLGLMPHPEDHVFRRQDPQWRRELGGGCLELFAAGVRAVTES
ncbi:MAG: phosphoribosylformylglycinamidine synthase subunit PurQ [Acidimicrobiales bacterium]